MENLAVLVAVGAVSGLFSGLLGIGGGVIIVPALILVLPHLGLAGPDLVKIAMATSLTTTVVTGLSGVQQHLARRAVDWAAMRRLTLGIMLGSFAGSQLSAVVDGKLLAVLFVGFVLYAALSMVRGRRAAGPAGRALPGAASLSVKGFAIGTFCSLLGIGGALFSVPLLSAYIPIQRAIGTATALGIPLAVTASVGYLLADTPIATCSSGCTGYVYLAGAGAIAAATILTAPLGAYLTHIMPTKPLRWVFAATMVAIATHMAWKISPNANDVANLRALLAPREGNCGVPGASCGPVPAAASGAAQAKPKPFAWTGRTHLRCAGSTVRRSLPQAVPPGKRRRFA